MSAALLQAEQAFDAICDELLARMKTMIAECPTRKCRATDNHSTSNGETA